MTNKNEILRLACPELIEGLRMKWIPAFAGMTILWVGRGVVRNCTLRQAQCERVWLVDRLIEIAAVALN